MEMSLENYIANPLGKQNAILNAATREIMKTQYNNKFDNLLLRYNGTIKYKLYYAEKNNAYWAHIFVPSEVVPNFFYNVVFKFTANQSIGGANDLFKYNCKFYSNDPAFVYTFAYVFRKNNIIIEELKSKMSKEALTKAPKEKNPTESVGYVKAIYFAYLLMKQRGLNKITRFKAESKELNPTELLEDIQDADTKISLRQDLGSKISKKKKIELSEKTLKNVEKSIGSKITSSNVQVKTTNKITAKKYSSDVNKNNVIKSVKKTKKK